MDHLQWRFFSNFFYGCATTTTKKVEFKVFAFVSQPNKVTAVDFRAQDGFILRKYEHSYKSVYGSGSSSFKGATHFHAPVTISPKCTGYFYWSFSCSISEKIISSDFFFFLLSAAIHDGQFSQSFPVQSPSQCSNFQLIKTYEPQHPFGIPFSLAGP